jgi:hypothetical protein
MKALTNFLQQKPVFLFILPLFFVLHNLAEIYQPYFLATAAELFLMYTTAGGVIAIIAWLFLKNWRNACLFSFILLAFNFFFGSSYDFIKSHFGPVFFLRYRFLIPTLIILVILSLTYFKKTKNRFARVYLFLNCLFLLLIIIDAVTILQLVWKSKPVYAADLDIKPTICDTCKKPDIYLIVADEYAGKQTLNDIFKFDNLEFENGLGKRGFHIINGTRSNYNATVFSMASFFGMGYIQNLRDTLVNHFDMFACREIIKKNNFQHFLESNGYEIFNCSMFEFNNKKNLVHTPFFVTKKEYFISQTFIRRFFNRVGFNFVSKAEIQKWENIHLYNNNKTFDAALKIPLRNTTNPVFAYIHLMLPHRPYYFDKNSNPAAPEILLESARYNKSAYIDYLQYSNKKILDLIDQIQKNSVRPPIIILMSDHGFRQFEERKFDPYYFINFSAIYKPDNNYTGFADSLTNVNYLRVLLNNQFNQKLSMLKDSAFFIKEP